MCVWESVGTHRLDQLFKRIRQYAKTISLWAFMYIDVYDCGLVTAKVLDLFKNQAE